MTAEAMTPARMVELYITLRDKKEAANAEFKKSMEKVNAAMEKLEGKMLQHLQETEGESIRTKYGTVYRNTQHSATVKDRDAFLKWIEDTGNTEAMDVRANKTFIKEFAENTGGDIPPGINFSQIHTVGVRRS